MIKSLKNWNLKIKMKKKINGEKNKK
jgi:hypothetical protein